MALGASLADLEDPSRRCIKPVRSTGARLYAEDCLVSCFLGGPILKPLCSVCLVPPSRVPNTIISPSRIAAALGKSHPNSFPCLKPLVTCPLFSVVPEQQACAHNDPEPPHPPDGRRVRLHRLHPHHAVRGRRRDPPHRPVRGDPHLAPPGWQMANCPLPQIRRALRPTAVSPVRIQEWGKGGMEGTVRAP